MSRKRSSFNILKDYSISSTPNQPSAEDFIITTRKRRTKVQCFCSKCNGNLVDPRTKKAHDEKLALVTHSAVIPPEETHHSVVIPPEEIPISQVLIEPTIERHSVLTISDSDVDEEQTIIFLPRKKRVKTNTLRHITNEITENDDSNGNDEFSEPEPAYKKKSIPFLISETRLQKEKMTRMMTGMINSKLPREDRFTWIL